MNLTACLLSRRALLLWGTMPAWLFSQAAVGAEPPRPQGPNFHDRLSIGYVLVPVVVRSGAGYVENLEVEDFVVSVDGKRVVIESFEEGPSAPVGVAFLQDLSGSMGTAGKLELSRTAIERFLHFRRPGDHFALASFANGHTRMAVAFTVEPAELFRAMRNWRAYGTTALHDAVSRLPEVTSGLESTKRAAILITDGVDNASHLTPTEARQRVREAELPVYVLGLSVKELPPGIDPGQSYSDLLRRLAKETGGAYFSLPDPRLLPRTAAAILRELRHQYVLGFSTSGNEAESYRRLQVKVTPRSKRQQRRHPYQVTFRRGYLGPPPSQAKP
jgi:VWFA-related protein